MGEETRKMEKESRRKKILRALKDCLLEGGLYLAVFFLTLILFLLLKPYAGYVRTGAVAKIFMVVSIGLILAVAAYLGITKRLSKRYIVFLLLLIGYVLRVGVMLAAAASSYQHDVFTGNFDGHEAYAWTIFETGALPTTNVYQFYHPPLNAFVQAGFMRFMDGLTALLGGERISARFAYGMPEYLTEYRYYLYSTCQILSVTYSFIISVVSVKMLKMFKFSDKIYLLLAAFVILFPRNIQFATSLNNDALSYLGATCALFFALRWWKKKSLCYILPCAISIGLGMMSKLSSATVAFPIAGIFIYEFARTLLKKEDSLKLWKMILQYGLFLLICAPLGLWFQVYAKIRFDQPFGYVFSNLNSKLYTGDHSLFSRFLFTFDISEYFGSIFCRPFDCHYNLFAYALRSSIFGEFSYAQGEGFAILSLMFAYMGVMLLFIGLIFCFVRFHKEQRKTYSLLPQGNVVSYKEFLFVFLLVQSQALSEIFFYAKMPYACTMDFRYIMPMIFGIALTFGFAQKSLAASKDTFALKINELLNIALVGFLVSASLFYCIAV